MRRYDENVVGSSRHACRDGEAKNKTERKKECEKG